ncbi:MAG TPA: hypothetical protein VHU60_09245 [Gaiellaceae bacterium]|jgi:hypothetical protein|nr:hypothetical protein [Gaiellaceae bacterium]
MSDQDRETRIDEDVEAHAAKGHVKSAAKGREDENDVEGHSHHATKGHAKGREDEGDDVEGHMQVRAAKGANKA